MNHLLFFVVLGAILITSGCVGGNKETVAPSTSIPQIMYVTVTSAPPPTSTVVQIPEPILGSWRFTSLPGDASYPGGSDTFQFNADGTVVEIFVPEGPGLTGTWSAVPGGNYQVDWGGANVEIFTYDPARNGIYFYKNPARLYTPSPADGAAVSSLPAPVPGSSSQSAAGSMHFSGNGNDVKTFTATGSGVRVFSLSYSGQHYFIVKLDDSEGGYVDSLADTIGSYSGKKTVPLRTGEYVLDIAASGPWTIDISSL